MEVDEEALEGAAEDVAWGEEASEAGEAEALEEAEVEEEEDLGEAGAGEEGEEEGGNSRRAALMTPGSALRSRSSLRVCPRAPR